MTQFKRIIPILVFVITALTFTSCDKEKIIETITESEAVEIIESALQSNAGSFTSNVEDIAEQLVTAATTGELCDTIYTNTIEEDYQGSQIQADYISDQSYEMTCNNFDVPQTATFSVSTISTYNSPRIVSDDDADFTGNVLGLQPSAPNLSLEGNYSKTGTQVLNFMEQKNISSSFTTALTNLEINKQSYSIESGSGTFLFTGSTPDENFSYNGTIVFNGNNTATLTINGTIYEIYWN